MQTEIKLDTKLVGAIEGEFYVPSYQRGYRWSEVEVRRLLDDIYANGPNSYCLQPVVVKRDGDRLELIDGQQRLTTLYILLKYIKNAYKPRIPIRFSLTYATRIDSADYLDSFDPALAETNIDFYHMYQAYKCIDSWFCGQPDDGVVAADDIYGYLVKNVKIFWYEVGAGEDPISLFTRLNIGKIPLTSAELVKALFLSGAGKNSLLETARQEEIALQWDNMEKELRHDALWYFLSNRRKSDYQTHIDLVLDLMARKAPDEKEKYFTFFAFDKRREEEALDDIWRDIQHTFLILRDWFEDHELYHKIGYLIASGKVPLQTIYDGSKAGTKAEFRAFLDQEIKSTVSIRRNYAELNYNTASDRQDIARLLLLFNVESVRRNGAHTQWFPFNKFKFDSSGKVSWSLEHIHAQQSEGLRDEKAWKEWLRLHIPSVRAVAPDGEEKKRLLQEMETWSGAEKLERSKFETIQERVAALLSAPGSTEYLHTIGNLALLRIDDNAALSNAAFDVKRNKIICMDQKGQFIPFCTRMVFLKYYTPSEKNQLHFWGPADRAAYVGKINEVLGNYLSENIETETEVE